MTAANTLAGVQEKNASKHPHRIDDYNMLMQMCGGECAVCYHVSDDVGHVIIWSKRDPGAYEMCSYELPEALLVIG